MGLAGDWSPLGRGRLFGLGPAGLVSLASPGVPAGADLLGVLAFGADARRLLRVLLVRFLGQALDACAHALLLDGLLGAMALVLDDHEVVTLGNAVAALVAHVLGKDGLLDRHGR